MGRVKKGQGRGMVKKGQEMGKVKTAVREFYW
jgi:hypothetical protein